MLIAERLRELLDYDAQTGVFTWKVRTSIRTAVGMRAGGVGGPGYWMISVDSKRYYGHRLAWLYVFGEWPKDGEIDHINGDRIDNRISNLREVSRSKNNENKREPLPNNKSGYLGVFRKRSRWTSRIRVNGKTHSLGGFDTPEAAHAAYLSAKRILHEGCTI
jgi:hypothetical protein